MGSVRIANKGLFNVAQARSANNASDIKDKQAKDKDSDSVENPVSTESDGEVINSEDLPVLEGAIEPTILDDLRDSLPEWLDEVMAISCLFLACYHFLLSSIHQKLWLQIHGQVSCVAGSAMAVS